MAKRKACGVSDIIYELDNDDIEISSDDDCKEPKITCLDTKIANNSKRRKTISESSSVEVIHSSEGVTCEMMSPDTKEQNGGKMSTDMVPLESSTTLITVDSQKSIETDVDTSKRQSNDCPNTLIFNEDIVVDSPANSDLGVVGCENKTPIISVRFRDKRLASAYKKKIKKFMLDLINLHEEDTLITSDNETDLELDIWPDDLNIDDSKDEDVDDSLFFVDTAPCDKEPIEIPNYSQKSELISNTSTQESSNLPMRKGPICFNCNGDHPLRDCTRPRNNVRIAENRKNMASFKVGRYHVEDEQKYGHLTPGRISGKLRHALGLKRNEIPLYIYRMRMLGYPPGWLEEARISHSGITMFDSTGNAIMDPEEEEGEVCEPGSKDKFDIKKILDFPGFNVPASSRYKEEALLYGLPPMSAHDSKLAMLQMLAPNAMKAYKRKKLTFFPSTNKEDVLQKGHAEMELGSDDEIEFPSVPPLPDEAPPPPPPPPDSPPPEDTLIQTTTTCDESSTQPETQSTLEIPLTQATQDSIEETTSQVSDTLIVMDSTASSADDTADDIEIIEVTQVKDIPVPESDFIVIDEYKLNSRSVSPSLDDLEEKKRQLLTALIEDPENMVTNKEIKDINVDKNTDENNDREDNKISDSSDVMTVRSREQNQKSEDMVVEIQNNQNFSETPNSPITSQLDVNSKLISPKATSVQETSDSDSDTSKSSCRKGRVKSTLYGAPVMNIVSSYVKLPSDENFAKDICDVINFENLPNSTGKYKQMNILLKKVKNEVDKIQDS